MKTQALTIHVAVEDAQAYETASPEVQRRVDAFLRQKLREAMRGQASLVTPPLSQPTDLGWPEEFFTRVAGGWQGEPLIRSAQGSYEDRDELL